MIFANYSTTTEEQLDTEVIEQEKPLHHIVLYNDDVNTFDWVIECLTNYCGHDILQAEQCAMIVHYNGKCAVKNGSLNKLKPICQTLLEKGLSAEIN